MITNIDILIDQELSLRAEVEALRALLNEAWPYVGSNLQERIDAAIAAQPKE